ncbi:MAG TPA: HAD family hydrolase [Gaiellaceae bacterium]|nr:HAD family hydrolase [Gaiellaceae bacterium]
MPKEAEAHARARKERRRIEAVTVDAFGTLVELRDPVDPLREALAARGVERDQAAVARAFAVEAAYYVRRSLHGRDDESLAALRRACAGVFLTELGAALDPGEFAPAFVGALEFVLAEGAREALDTLRRAGLRLACVANWDCSLPGHLEGLGVADRFDVLAVSALVGAEKPDPAIFDFALARLAVQPAQALHIGDGEADRAGAVAVGLAFEPAPLATLPARLGLGD